MKNWEKRFDEMKITYTNSRGEWERKIIEELHPLAIKEIKDFLATALEEQRKDEYQKTLAGIDWEMVLSELELLVKNNCYTKTLDSSDQSSWGEDYKKLNKIATDKFNQGVKYCAGIYTTQLRAKLAELKGEK